MERLFSRRIAALSPSPTLALNSKAAELVASGKNIFNFAVGEPDFPTPQAVVDIAIDSLRRGRTRYGASGGGKPLRDAIAAKLRRDNNLDFSIDEIVCGIGAKEILFHVFLALLNDGDEVLLPAPYWVSYGDQIRAAGAVPVTVAPPASLTDPNGEAIDFAGLESAVTPHTRAIVINSPNNPSGYMLDHAELTNLAAFARKHKIWVIADEIYEYMDFERPHASLLALHPDLRSRFILINGLSKGFAMTGWRVGYAAGPKDAMALVRNLESHSSTCIPGFIEDAATYALNQGRALMAPAIKTLDHRRKLTMTALDGFKFARPDGAFYVFLDVRDISRGRSTLEISAQLLNDGVAVVPGEAFGVPGFLRISYTLGEQELLAGLERIKTFLLQP